MPNVRKHTHTPQPPSITVTRRHDRAIYTCLVHQCIRPFKSKFVKLPDRFEPAGSPQLEIPREVKAICRVSERLVEGTYVYDISTKADEGDGIASTKRVYYFAGGGWSSKPSKDHWLFLAELSRRLPTVSFSLVSYPLAPNSPAPHALPQIARLCHAVLREADKTGEQVVLAGDSAGGNVVLCTVINALNTDPEGRVPSAVLAISPSTDLRRANPDMARTERHDPILNREFVVTTANAWRGEWEPTDPRISPLYADVTQLARRGVKIHGITGRYDILGLDGVLMREKLNQAWVEGQWLDWDKQMHVFPIAFNYKLPESVAAVQWIEGVLKDG